MSGYFVGGLGDGLIQGFNAVEQWRHNRKESERQDRQDERQAKLDEENQGYKKALLDLQSKQYGLAEAKQGADIASEQTRMGILSDTLGLDRQKLGLAAVASNQSQQQIDDARALNQAKLGLAQQENQRQQQSQWYQDQENAIKIKEAQRVMGLKEVQDTLYPKLVAGTFGPKDAEAWKQKTGLDLRDLVDNSKVDAAVNAFNGLREGKIKPDDPSLLESAKWLYGSHLQRGIGEVMHPVDEQGRAIGPDIVRTSKEPIGFFQGPDGNYGLHLLVKGKDADGNEHAYQAQMTRFGTDDPRDPVMSLPSSVYEKPLAAAMHINNAFNQDPELRATVEKSLGMTKDANTALQGDKLRAEALKARAEAGKTFAETGQIVTGEKNAKDKMEQVISLANSKYGGKWDPISNSMAGADPEARDSVVRKASELIKQNPSMSGVDLYGKAEESHQTEFKQKQADQIRAQFQAGKLKEKDAIEQLKSLGFE